MKRAISLLGYNIHTSINNLKSTNKKLLINTINPHSYIIAKKDLVFQKALKESDILLPDGIGIVWAVKLLTGQKIKRIAGADIHEYLLSKLNSKGGKVFYMGSTINTLQKIEEKIKIQYSNLLVASYSPPFKTEFSAEDNYAIIKAINKVKPDVLFVGMTAPKQEKWVYQNKDKLNTKVICSIGAVFDFYAGTVKRSSPFWINIGLEWVPRFIKQPKKLWKRVFISNPLFVLNVLKYKFINNEK